MFSMEVTGVWFDDHYGEDVCETQINCDVVEETDVGSGPESH